MPFSFQTLTGAINGILGDHLVQTDNPLATEMCLLCQNVQLDCEIPIATQVHKPLSNRVVIFVHGLTNTEQIWNFPVQEDEASPSSPIAEDNYGTRLEREYGLTHLYVRYNSGLSIEENGKKLSELLENLTAHYPLEIDHMIIVGFSMGGLLSRHAQAIAQEQDLSWHKNLRQCVYIGTPHEGAPLEKFADLTATLLASLPKAYVNHWADWLAIRSTGIQDLKEGFSSYEKDHSFHGSAQHYFISGGLAKRSNSPINHALGDSLVRKKSAHPQDRPADSESAHFDGIHHIELAHNSIVYEQLKSWLKPCQESPLLKVNINREVAANDHVQARIDAKAEFSEVGIGSAMLLADAYNQVVLSVRTLHEAISEESYSRLKKVPIAPFVEAQHQKVSNGVFDTLQATGKAMQKTLHKINQESRRTRD